MNTVRTILNALGGKAKNGALLDAFFRYHPIYYREAVSFLGQAKNANQETILGLSQKLLSRTLRWASCTRGAHVARDTIEDWPILEKETIRSFYKDYYTPWTFGVPASTSGTTGVPIRLKRSFRCIAAEQAFLDNILSSIGFNLKEYRFARLCGDNVVPLSATEPPFWKQTHRGRRLILSSSHISSQTAKDFAHILESFQPHVLFLYPNAGEALALHFEEQNIRIKVPVILSSSEVLHSSGRRLLERVFEAQVIDYYGLAERTAFAVSYKPDEYYFNPIYGYIELIPTTEVTPVGLSAAEIISTSYWNDAMPLIRYRTGDRVLYPTSYSSEDLKRVSLGFCPVNAFLGRDQNFINSPRGEKLVGLDHLPREVNHILRMQIIQEDTRHVRLHVIPNVDFSHADAQLLMKNARLKIPEDMDVTLHMVKELETLSSGKIPYVIRKMSQSATSR